MEVSFIEHETFLLYLAIFILFFFCSMLLVVAAQLDEFNKRIAKERDDLLQLLGREMPEEFTITDKNTLVGSMLQDKIIRIKDASVKMNEQLGKRTRLLVPERPVPRHRKIFIEKILDVE